MWEQLIEDICAKDVTVIGSVFKLMLSLLLGAIVGVERRQKGQVAGMRTFSLIAMGATMAMLVSIYIPQEYLGLKNGGIWMTACLGLAVGAGMYVVSVAACIFILAVYRILEQIEKVFLKSAEQKIVRLKVNKIITDGTPYRACFRDYRVHISDEFLRYDYTQGTTIINFMVRSKDDTDFLGLFERIHSMGDILSLTLTNEVNN